MSDSQAGTPGATPQPTAKGPDSGQTKILTVGDEPGRGEVSAATIGRMLGLASMRELTLLDGKLDLVMSKVNNLMVRLDRIVTMMGSAPTGKDLERIDVQIAALRTQLREAAGMPSTTDSAASNGAAKKAKIVSSEEPVESGKTES